MVLPQADAQSKTSGASACRMLCVQLHLVSLASESLFMLASGGKISVSLVSRVDTRPMHEQVHAVEP